jgi:hypothetical protein
MLHSSIHNQYVPQRALFGRLLRLAFAFAGMFWFLLYALPIETHETLRSGQSVIYFILLSLWGIDYLREAKRLRIIIEIANERQCPPNDVTSQDIAAKHRSFAVTPWTNGSFHPLAAAMWLMVVVALVLIAKQYLAALAVLLA